MAAEHPSPSDRDVLRIAEAIVSDEAIADDIAKLDAILREEPSARSTYLDYIDIHAGLRRRYLSPEPDVEEVRHTTEKSATDRVSEQQTQPTVIQRYWAPSVLAIAATLAGVVVTQSSLIGRDGSTERTVPAQEASFNGVAVLSRTVDVEWSAGASAIGEGSPVPAGVVSIESGIVQFDFYSGAIAVLEGPGSLELVSAERAVLSSGKLRARVPTRARGFAIETASGTIVDLGTEFAVEAPGDGAPGELHVVDGEVQYHPKTDGPTESVNLNGGDAVWLDQAAAGTPPRRGVKRFIGPTEVETLARRNSTDRQEAWGAHREKLLADSDLIALYAYSAEPEWSRLFRNFAVGAGDDSHGAVVGAEWVEGRWPGHKALGFRNASHRVSISLPGSHDSLTLASWIVVDRFHPTNRIALMHPELGGGSALFWTINRTPTGGVLHFAETAKPKQLSDRNHYSSVRHGLHNTDVGTWVHLAVVYDANALRVTHFRDGAVVGSKAVQQPRPLSIGEADLGNWPYKDWAKGTEFEMRNLQGRMDEFVAIGRALSEDEIREMHAMGAP